MAESERLNLARCLLFARRQEEVSALLEPLGDRDDFDLLALTAECALLQGDRAEVLRRLDRMQSADGTPARAESWTLRAIVLHGEGAREEAQRCLVEAERVFRDTYLPWRSVRATRRLLEGGEDVRAPLWKALGMD
jgi:hypothetical protein